jgi:hypothetical protein
MPTKTLSKLKFSSFRNIFINYTTTLPLLGRNGSILPNVVLICPQVRIVICYRTAMSEDQQFEDGHFTNFATFQKNS